MVGRFWAAAYWSKLSNNKQWPREKWKMKNDGEKVVIFIKYKLFWTIHIRTEQSFHLSFSYIFLWNNKKLIFFSLPVSCSIVGFWISGWGSYNFLNGSHRHSAFVFSFCLKTIISSIFVLSHLCTFVHTKRTLKTERIFW